MELVQIPSSSQLPAGHDGSELATSTPPPAAPPPEVESGDVEMSVDLPRPIFDFLFSEQYRKSQSDLRTYAPKLTDDQYVLIGDMSRLVMGGAVPLDEALDTVADELKPNISDEERDTLFAHILADRFVPLGDAIKPTALEVASKRGLKLPEVPYYRVYLKPLTYAGAGTEIATACGFSLMGGQLRERMRELVLSKIKGVRVDAQVREILVRPQEFGGLGIDAKTADRAIGIMNEILGRTNVISEEEYADWLASQSGKPAGTTVAATRSVENKPTATIAQSADDREDEQEIASIKSKMPERPISVLDSAIDETMQRISYQPPDEYLTKRIRNIISSRLRDVRTSDDVRQLLTRDTKVGGLGLASVDANRVAGDIESGYSDFHERVATEEQKKLEAQLEEQKKKVAERRQLDAAEHAKWYEERIRARKERESESQEAFGVLKAAATTALESKEKRVEAVKYGPLVPAKTPEAPIAPVAKPGVKVSPSTVEIAKQKVAERPTLDAMSAYAGPKLMGMMGELQGLSVAEFRRLAKDPREAAKKVTSLLATLAQESFERKTAGIAAFRSSPLQGAYLTLVAESFKTGRPVAQVAEEKRKAGENVLSSDEIAAIMELNSALQY